MELIRNSPNNSTFSKIYVIVSRMERSVWKEERCQKHEVAFRSKLKAGVNTKKSEQPKRPAPDKPDESVIDFKKAKTS
eukprot:scaffold23818_cov167-Skeletonema_marinoi.AAC.2